MSPLPNRSSQPSESASHSSSPADQVNNPLETPVEQTVDNLSEPDSDVIPPESTSEEPRLVLKRPVMRPIAESQPPEPPPVKSETAEPIVPAKVENSSKSSGQSPTALESVPDAENSDASPSPTGEADSAASVQSSSEQAVAMRQHPIPPPSEPMQYRAIGLIRGRYTPSEEQFTRGELLTTDNVKIEAVLLGRVMSLVKNHLDLTQDHLWVVYPRTREKQDDDLHAQIVGVWEPEKLNKTAFQDSELSETEEDTSISDEFEEELEEELEELSEQIEESELPGASEASLSDESDVESSSDEATVETVPSAPQLELIPASDLDDNYFSIRGEVIFQSQEPAEIIVKIQQSPRKRDDKLKAFKLKIRGLLQGRAVGHFWDLHVKREAAGLVITEGTSIGMIPPKKKKGGKRFGGGGAGGRKPFRPAGKPGSYKPMGSRPSDNRSKPSEYKSSDSSAPRRPTPKPVKKREQPSQDD